MVKRVSISLFALVVVLGMVACSKNDDSLSKTITASKKSVPKTLLRSAMSSVKSTQVGQGQQDFSGVTIDILNQEDSDVEYIPTPLVGDEGDAVVSVLTTSAERIIIQSREPLLGLCFFVELNASSAPRYGSSIVGPKHPCGLSPDPKTGSDFTTSQTTGWSTKADK